MFLPRSNIIGIVVWGLASLEPERDTLATWISAEHDHGKAPIILRYTQIEYFASMALD